MAPRQPTTKTRQVQADDPIEDPGLPIDQTPQPQEAHPDEPRPAEQGEITRVNDLMQPPEVEVDPIREPPIAPPNPDALVVIRMNTTLEDFTYGNPHMHMRMEEGHRYRVPLYIGQYLDGLGYVYH